MPALLRIAEAQMLYDGLSDPLLASAIELFIDQQRKDALDSLVHAVRQSVRDTMKEATIAGRVAAYEDMALDLRKFAEEQLRSASQ